MFTEMKVLGSYRRSVLTSKSYCICNWIQRLSGIRLRQDLNRYNTIQS
jgi:hypothetical protein